MGDIYEVEYENEDEESFTVPIENFEHTENIIYIRYLKNGKTHREDGPAEIGYNDDGSVYSEYWYLNGEEVSIVDFANHLGVDHHKWENGEVYIKHGELHKEDGPACVGIRYGSKIEEWYLNGEELSPVDFANHLGVEHYKSETLEIYLKDEKLHKEDGPAKIGYNDYGHVDFEEWYLNGELHREDDPADISYNGDGSVKWEIWRFKGKLHREDGPAKIEYYDDGSVCKEEWYLNGELHREDGPAEVIYGNDEHDDGDVYNDR